MFEPLKFYCRKNLLIKKRMLYYMSRPLLTNEAIMKMTEFFCLYVKVLKSSYTGTCSLDVMLREEFASHLMLGASLKGRILLPRGCNFFCKETPFLKVFILKERKQKEGTKADSIGKIITIIKKKKKQKENMVVNSELYAL